jgi:hypothetical protein
MAEESNYAAKFLLALFLSVLFCAVVGIASFAFFGIGAVLIAVAVAAAVTIVPVITSGVGHVIGLEGKRNRGAMRGVSEDMRKNSEGVLGGVKKVLGKSLDSSVLDGSSAATEEKLGASGSLAEGVTKGEGSATPEGAREDNSGSKFRAS